VILRDVPTATFRGRSSVALTTTENVRSDTVGAALGFTVGAAPGADGVSVGGAEVGPAAEGSAVLGAGVIALLGAAEAEGTEVGAAVSNRGVTIVSPTATNVYDPWVNVVTEDGGCPGEISAASLTLISATLPSTVKPSNLIWYVFTVLDVSPACAAVTSSTLTALEPMFESPPSALAISLAEAGTVICDDVAPAKLIVNVPLSASTLNCCTSATNSW
tara:strand:- start:275 stop:928 length:654 start_codon:yes stop_codon:yes gene_type:complete